MYAILAATAGRMKYVSRVDLPKTNSAEVFMQRAIACLHVYLKSCTSTVVDKQIIVDVLLPLCLRTVSTQL